MMRSFHQVLTSVAACALLISFSGCTEKQKEAVDNSTVPISTESKKARELYLQGRDMQERLLFQQSRATFEQAVKEDPEFALGYLGLAFAQATNKGFFENFDKSKEFAAKASQGEQLMIMATDAGNSGDGKKQNEALRTLTQLYPNDPRAHNLIGNFYFAQQKYPESIRHLIKATELDSSFIPPYNMLGYANRSVGNYEQAEVAFKRYIKLLPGDPNPYDSYAELLLKMGRFEESIQNYRKALEIKPDFVFSYVGIASDYSLMDKGDEARKTLDQMLSVATDDGQRRTAWFGKAVSYIHEGNHAQALAAMEEELALAHKIDDRSAMSQDVATMGSILFDAGNYVQALTRYEEADQLIQSSRLSQEQKLASARTALYNRARCTAMKGDLAAAKGLAEQYMQEILPLGDANQMRLAYEVKGLIALQEKDFAEATAAFELGNKQNALTLYRLAVAYKGLGNDVKAIEYCKQAAGFNGLNDLNYAFARTKAKAMLSEFPSA